MKMKPHLASLFVLLATSAPLLSATETERLRALCAEQELQIAQLELKLARLTDSPPPSRPTTAARDFEPVAEVESGTYTVRSGDSIERIARKHGVSTAALGKLNGLKSNSIIHPGQKLKVPGTTATANSNTTPAPVAASRTHTVATGDTFYKISRKYGVSVNGLISANPSVNHNALRIGQKIRIESAGNPAPVASKPAPSLGSSPSIPISNSQAPIEKPKATKGPVKIEKEITYGQFAKNHNTTTRRLDELNGLELDPSTVLAQGSELYIPAQP